MNKHLNKIFSAKNIAKNKGVISKGLTSCFGVFTAISGAFKLAVKKVGWFAIDCVFGSYYFMAIIGIFVVLFLMNFLPQNKTQDRGRSWIVVCLILVAVFFCKPAFEGLKFNLTIPEHFYAVKFEKGDMALQEVYDVLGIKDNIGKNMLLCTLFKDSSCKNNKLIKAVVKDLRGWNIMSGIDKDLVTYSAVIYANEDVFTWLCSEGIINISKDKLYPKKTFLNTPNKENKVDILELAQSYSRDKIAAKINLFLNLKQSKTPN